MKRTISLLLALCLLAACATGCGAGTSSTAEASATSQTETVTETAEATAPEETQDETPAEPQESAVEETAASAEPEETQDETPAIGSVSLEYPIADGDVTFTYCYQHMTALNGVGIDDYSANPSWQLAQDATGINLDWVPLSPQTSNDTMALWIASGDLPDITGVFEYSDGLDAAVEEDVIISLDGYEDYYPAYQTLLNSDEQFYKDCLTDNGNLDCFCVMTNESRRLDAGLMIRQDWLDELGLEIPTTIDDLTDVLTAFHDKYNAGIALYSGLASNSYSLCNAYGIAAFNTFESFWYQVDGEVRMGMIQPEYKDYLTLLNSWYEAGLINENLITQMGMAMDATVDEINASEVGVWFGWVDSMTAWEENIGGGAKVSAMADPVLHEGDTLKLGGPSTSVKGDESFYITTCCSDPELAIGFLDYFYTDEGIMVANYGVENVTYVYNDQGEPEFTELITNNDLGLAAVNATQAYAIYSIGTYQYLNRYDSMYTEAQMNAYQVHKSNKTNEWDYDSRSISMTADENTEYSAIMSDINTYMSTATLQFVMGARSLDEFDDYVADIEAMNIDRAIEIKQAAYDRYVGR